MQGELGRAQSQFAWLRPPGEAPLCVGPARVRPKGKAVLALLVTVQRVPELEQVTV